MATLNIRNLPDEVHRRLRVRAAQHGRSMEAEAREIISTACRTEGERSSVADLQSFVRELYEDRPPTGVVDALIGERRLDSERE